MLILFDIDETLIFNNKLPTNYKNIRLLIRQLKNKIDIGICTNRPYDRNVKNIMKIYGIDGPIISENGACVYKSKRDNLKINNNLNTIIYSKLIEYLKNNNRKEKVKILNFVPKVYKNIILNNNRNKTCTLRLPITLEKNKTSVLSFLKNLHELKDFEIVEDNYNNLKINIYKKDINKLSAIKKFNNYNEIILVSDYERLSLNSKDKSIKIYSVGNDETFNNKCDKVFPSMGIGVENILKELLEKENVDHERIRTNK